MAALLDTIVTKCNGDGVSKLLVLEVVGNKFGDVAMDALEQVTFVWSKLGVALNKRAQ